LNPELILLDVEVPGLDSFELVTTLSRELPAIRVVMFSGFLRPEFQERALESGAWGFLSKGATPKDVVQALRRVAMGHVVGGEDD
ncbi:MAG: response regulator transcription factor, partial [Gemmatimonadaceae bacterium]